MVEYYINIKVQLPLTGRSSSTVMFYICRRCPGGTQGERLVKKKHVFTLQPFTLSPQLCIYKVIEPSLVSSPKTPCSASTVSLWARYRGLTRQKRKVNTKYSNVKRAVAMQAAREIYAGMEPLVFNLVEVITFDRAD